jgi:hypothetical protein
MSSEWKTYKVEVKNLELLLSARSEAEARETVLDSIRKGQLSERVQISDKNVRLKITPAKGLQ